MPRKPRTEEPGGIYHVTIHALEGETLVLTDRDRQRLVDLLNATVKRFGWLCLGVSILDTHVHLLIVTPNANLQAGMQFLSGTYAQDFNRRHGRRGHLLRERYWSKRVESDSQLKTLVRYIALNAVEARIAPSAREHPWSSYPGVIGAARCWSFVARTELLEHFGPGESAIGRLEEFVEGSAAKAS